MNSELSENQGYSLNKETSCDLPKPLAPYKASHLPNRNWTTAYGVECYFLSENSGFPEKPPFQVVEVQILPGQNSVTHSHFELECFIVLVGKLELNIQDKKQILSPGEMTHVPSGYSHQLNNPFKEPVRLLSIYSDRLEEDLVASPIQIFSAPPTPNGNIHLGHLSGPYLVADILKRAVNLRGGDAVHLSGTDDHQSYVHSMAKVQNKSQFVLAKAYHEQIAKSFEDADIEMDEFFSPIGNKTYRDYVQNFFLNLYNLGFFEPQSEKLPFDSESGQYLIEDLSHGSCLNCEELIYGSTCESCGFVMDAADFEYSKKSNVDYKEVTRLKFALDQEKISKGLKKWQDKTIRHPELKKMIHGVFSKISTFSVTVPSNTGIPVPVKGFEGHSIHVWVEMAAYLGYIGRGKKGDKVLSFGFDNSFYYTKLVPAIWIAAGIENLLPKNLLFNYFTLLEGEKFSTSRQHAIWVDEFLTDQNSDEVRFYLSMIRSDFQSESFSVEEFHREIDRNLRKPLKIIEGFLERNHFDPSFLGEKEKEFVKNPYNGELIGELIDPEFLEWHLTIDRLFGLKKFSTRKVSRLLLTELDSLAGQSLIVTSQIEIHKLLLKIRLWIFDVEVLMPNKANELKAKYYDLKGEDYEVP